MHRRSTYPMFGMGDAAGGVTSVADATKALRQQVGRFGESAPAGYRFVDGNFKSDMDGPLDGQLALVAVTIYQRAATDSFNKFHDTGSAAAIASANSGFANPVAWVGANTADVASYIKAYADSIGLPAATGATSSMILYVLLAGGVLLWLVNRDDPSRSP